MPHIGAWELFALLPMLALMIAPVAIGIWIIVMLIRVRSSQESIQSRLEAIERAIQK